MTSPIDPVRQAAAPSARRAEDRTARSTQRAADRNLPVPAGPPIDAAPQPAGSEIDAGSAFAAQLMGQDGQKRGLRGGPPVLHAAKESYSRTEWSGPADRRAPKGRRTKTDI